MLYKDLVERQNWSLNQKIDHAVGTIESFIARTGKIPYVAFSGGKDSSVLLDICRRFVNKDMEAVFDNTGNEYPEIIKFVKSTENVTIITPKVNIRKVIEKYGFPLISKEVAQYIHTAKTTKSSYLKEIRLNGRKGTNGKISYKIPEKWKFLINEPFMISDKCCSILKKKPFECFKNTNGKLPIIGTMAAESKLRMNQYIKRGGCNSFAQGKEACYPISIWTEKDIWAYILKFNVKICSLYTNSKCKRTGCMFCGFGAHLENSSRFEVLYNEHPTIYKTILKYSNNNVTYRQALHKIGVVLPDEYPSFKFN